MCLIFLGLSYFCDFWFFSIFFALSWHVLCIIFLSAYSVSCVFAVYNSFVFLYWIRLIVSLIKWNWINRWFIIRFVAITIFNVLWMVIIFIKNIFNMMHRRNIKRLKDLKLKQIVIKKYWISINMFSLIFFLSFFFFSFLFLLEIKTLNMLYNRILRLK